MYKKGATLTNFVLLIGMLLVSIIIIVSMRTIIFKQTEETQINIYDLILDTVKSSIESAQTLPQGSQFEIRLPRYEHYEMRIYNNKISAYFPQADITMEKHFFVSNINVIPSIIKNQASFYFILQDSNLFITENLKCNVSDSVCDTACLAHDICDPECYKDYYQDVCISACVDTNHNGAIDEGDADTICDLDCYNTQKNGGVYDVDCLESDDNICDPDTHMIYDNYCDNDCLANNGVCDPDCGFYDIDCPYNNICEPERFETCENSPDCANCTAIMGRGAACRPGCPGTDTTTLCLEGTFKIAGETCDSDCECDSDLICQFNRDTTSGYCCPEGSYFNGQDCTEYLNDGVDDSVADYGPGENCLISPRDVQCSPVQACCPADAGADPDTGCVDAYELSHGQDCICTSQCSSGLTCTGRAGSYGCCLTNEFWDGSECIDPSIDTQCTSDAPYFETCENEPDCQCSDYGLTCCPDYPAASESGCAPQDLQREDICYCTSQCTAETGMHCSGSSEKHCCLADEVWDGTQCTSFQLCQQLVPAPPAQPGDPEDMYDIVFIPYGFDASEMDDFLQIAQQHWEFVKLTQPITSIQQKFNIWAITRNIDTWIDCTQDTAYPHYWKCREVSSYNAAQMHCSPGSEVDTVVVIVNDTAWSGYRWGPQCTSPFDLFGGDVIVKTSSYPQILVHELGHSWTLDDEYLANDTTYPGTGHLCGNCFYPPELCDDYTDCETPYNLVCHFRDNVARSSMTSVMYHPNGSIEFNDVSAQIILEESQKWG